MDLYAAWGKRSQKAKDRFNPVLAYIGDRCIHVSPHGLEKRKSLENEKPHEF